MHLFVFVLILHIKHYWTQKKIKKKRDSESSHSSGTYLYSEIY